MPAVGAAMLVVIATPAAAETMTNDTVIALEKAGLGENLLVDKINSEACGYDVSTGALIRLKAGGLPETVISAMVRKCAGSARAGGTGDGDSSADPKVRHSPGIYALEDWSSPHMLQLLRPSHASGLKTTGNGSVIFPYVLRLTIPGDRSHILLPTHRPVFYFYFNPADKNVSDFGQESSKAAQSPEEFSLVAFRVKNGERQVDLGKASGYGGAFSSIRRGIDPKYTIAFSGDDEGDGAFKVSANTPLDAGEYAFVFTGANGAARLYEFSVVDPSAASASTSR